MSTIITYKCDRCEDERVGKIEHPWQLWEIKLAYDCLPFTQKENSYLPVWVHWCRKCMAEMGLLDKPQKKDGTVEESPVTIEDLVREIIRTETK